MHIRSSAFVGSNGGAWDYGHSFLYVLMLISEADAPVSTSIFTVVSFTIRLTVKGLLGRRPSKHQLVVSDSVTAVSGIVSSVVI